MSNDNINLLRDNPENTLLRLAIPIMITMIATSIYNIIDGMWISGLGTHSISSVGLFTPIWMIINGLSSGLANGASSSVARMREESDQKANIAGEQSIIILILASITLSIVLGITLIPFLNLFHVNSLVYQGTIDFAWPLIAGLITFITSMGLAGILRAEGDNKRAMYAITLGVILNGVLDPVFIYILNMGIVGASVSTVFTSFISTVIIIYWMFIKKDTYIKLNISNILKLKINWEISKDILKTGIPTSVALFMLSFASFILYYLLNILSGHLGVGILSSGNRVYIFGLMPINAVSSAIVAIVGTHYGAKNIEYVKKAHSYASLCGFIFGCIVAAIFIIFSDQLAYMVLMLSNNNDLHQGVSIFISCVGLGLPLLGICLPSTYLYQGLGKGLHSLCLITFCEVICAISTAYLFGFTLGYGIIGIWLGLAVGRSFSSIIIFIITRITIKNLKETCN